MAPSASAIVGLSLVILLGACAAGPTGDQVGRTIQRYYAAHAVEEDGRCRQPRIDTITERAVLDNAGRTSRLHVSYSYFDPTADMDSNWDSLFNKAVACSGFAERDFSIERTEIGYRVVEMSGATRTQTAHE